MRIRQTSLNDFSEVMAIYTVARNLMKKNGNPNQWIHGYPSRELIKQDIVLGKSFVCENEKREIIGTFCFISGNDPTYAVIHNGKWLNNEPYATIHRIASSGKQKGMAKKCFDWSFTQIANVRVDTHRENKIMRNFLIRYGFSYCGIIHLPNGAERMAYQLKKIII